MHEADNMTHEIVAIDKTVFLWSTRASHPPTVDTPGHNYGGKSCAHTEPFTLTQPRSVKMARRRKTKPSAESAELHQLLEEFEVRIDVEMTLVQARTLDWYWHMVDGDHLPPDMWKNCRDGEFCRGGDHHESPEETLTRMDEYWD